MGIILRSQAENVPLQMGMYFACFMERRVRRLMSASSSVPSIFFRSFCSSFRIPHHHECGWYIQSY